MLIPFIGPMSASNPTGAPGVETLTISANTSDWNLIDALGYTPGVATTVNITINAAVVISSSNTLIPAMDLRGLPSGSTINLTNNGYVLGRGGDGGNGGSLSNGSPGWAGGPAIYGPSTGNTLNITNASGNIWGGGGGGGGGGTDFFWASGEPFWVAGGGGGGGAGVSTGGEAGVADAGAASPGVDGTGGAAGTFGAGGSGDTAAGAAGGDGGAGGAYGSAGTAGQSADGIGGSGGAAGYYVRSNGGTVNFVSGGTAPNVKGSAD